MDSVLIVEADADVLQLLTRWVSAAGFRARPFSSADAGLTAMSIDPAAVVLCNLRMWGHDGMWLAHRMRADFPDTAIIMASGVENIEAVIACFRLGVIDYLVKPFSSETTREAVRRGVEWHRRAVATRQRLDMLEQEFRGRHTRLTAALAEAEGSYQAALDAMLAMLQARNQADYEHAHRVARLSVNIAMVLGVTEPELSDIERAGLLHDVGKIATPEAVLSKPAPLSPSEWKLMRQHPQLGYEVLKHVPFLTRVAEIVRGSHEWYGGQGYPQGLRGEEISLSSRIVAVAEAYDAMVTPHVYRDSLPPEIAILELSRGRGSQFDPKAVDALLRVIAAA